MSCAREADTIVPMPTGDQKGTFVLSALSAVLDGADEGIVIFDGTCCRMIGRRAADLFGMDSAAYIGRTGAELFTLFATACDEPDALYELARRGETSDVLAPAALEIDIVRPRPRKVLLLMYPIHEAERTVGTVVLFRDVTRERSADRARAQLQSRLEEVTTIDALTCLPNRRRFHEDLEREHGRSTRAWDSYAVLRVDIDEMQVLNDELGMPVGDTILEQAADRLNGTRREYDLVARYEDDEFIVLLPSADPTAAASVAARMQKAIDDHDFHLPGSRPVTISIGAALWSPPSGESALDIVRRAGIALARARSEGTGRVFIDADDRK